MELEPIENPIVIHPHLLQRFLKHGKDYANLLALYSFYLYHAQLQKTNQPLVTDEFTRKGMNWASDRVKKVKKILKEMKIIEVVQNRKYYYVHLFFIYTKKKIGEILGKSNESQNNSETEDLSPKKEIKPTAKPLTSTVPPVLKQWVEYCDKNGIHYNKSNIKYWENKLKNRVTIDQQQAVYTAINKKWKDFYMVSTQESKIHKLLGRSLKMEKECDTLLNIYYKDKKYIYQFKNIKVTTTQAPIELFKKYEYHRDKNPIASKFQETIMSLVKRF